MRRLEIRCLVRDVPRTNPSSHVLVSVVFYVENGSHTISSHNSSLINVEPEARGDPGVVRLQNIEILADRQWSEALEPLHFLTLADLRLDPRVTVFEAGNPVDSQWVGIAFLAEETLHEPPDLLMRWSIAQGLLTKDMANYNILFELL